jgi:solute carrier family 25 phosphate transporter 23/24/25/41
VSEEGILELYRGLGPSVIGVIPYAGVNYFAYDSLRSLYKRWSKTDRVGNIQTLLIGSLAGVIASTSTFPLEVARKYMQVSISFSSIMNSTKSAFTSVTSSQFHQKPST